VFPLWRLLAITGVGVEKVAFLQKQLKLGDRKRLGKP
jgi:hypothetical protein